ncbi:hypothetical protein IQB76_03495 [Leptospira borgpetersenii serovar Hardjo-bovis]|uniref:Uncharacterized protein n=1 Tax=Leptospira borgpetersenii serovar Hardjo-bovis str. Sponselee TaxID=1303729 RepID=M6C715_LEPBO|nr:hypothetical protein [Leptospira borgpetersenii]AMX57018.1 hypothetical protein LBK6_00960 [Leptospira borgpetersenii serovar Hardjo]AWV68940.1 hypothetical protein B9T54_01060 [Leptospira borgpetersenii serovar Hardjo-bovis]EMJ82045.1 hypothetical protein LEP1GSC016_2688 [Leptospira borgpetersenii serovar Hardjo-bovis str. Sponselee]AMX60249.1 hypothetical protein LBK9_00960 [Leptospira borgpetersenii serovar Hardjo]AMX63496.1 hypothetical protein LBK30_00975 [Leptospira borgpetersenii ser
MNQCKIFSIILILISMSLYSEKLNPNPPSEQKAKTDLYDYWIQNYKKAKLERCEKIDEPEE